MRTFRSNIAKKSVKTNAGNLGHLTMSHRFVLFLKVVIDAIKMSMTFLFFAFFLQEDSPAKSPPNPKDHYPPTLKICHPSLLQSLCLFCERKKYMSQDFSAWQKIINFSVNIAYYSPCVYNLNKKV